jgi:protein-disulfide isomerase
MKRNLPLVIIAGMLVIACVATYVLFRSKQASLSAPFREKEVTQPVALASPSPSVNATVASKIPVGVSVTVEEYGDYQCPPCGLLHPELKKIKSEYGASIDFVFRNYPLPTIHKNAVIAAQAAEAARLQDRFWQMHDHLYDHQAEWKDDANPRSIFTKYAQDLGLDAKRFEKDIDGHEVQQRLAQDKQRADSMGVAGTPTIFIEGRQLKVEATNPDGIRKGIDRMLAEKAGHQ